VAKVLRRMATMLNRDPKVYAKEYREMKRGYNKIPRPQREKVLKRFRELVHK
jgi:hypothetical protein